MARSALTSDTLHSPWSPSNRAGQPLLSPSPLRNGVIRISDLPDINDADSDAHTRLKIPFSEQQSPCLKGKLGHSRAVSASTCSSPGAFFSSQTTFSPNSSNGTCSSLYNKENRHYLAQLTSPSVKSRSIRRCPSYITQPKLNPVTRSDSFASLAPLQTPRKIPQTPVETERSLKRQADTMTRLSLHDDDDDTGLSDESDSDVGIDQKLGSKRKKDTTLSRKRGRPCRGQRLAAQHVLNVLSTPSPYAPTTFFTSDSCPNSPYAMTSQSLQFSPSPSHRRVTRSRHVRNRSQSSTSSPDSEPYFATSQLESKPFVGKKYRPRDSGVGGMSESDDEPSALICRPASPSSLSLSNTGDDELPDVQIDYYNADLVTPGLQPPVKSAWPGVGIHADFEEEDEEDAVEEFILQTLASGAAAVAANAQERRMQPHTPVKRHAYLALGPTRPWMSVQHPTTAPSLDAGMLGKARKSMPATLNSLVGIGAPLVFDSSPPEQNCEETARLKFSPLGNNGIRTPFYEGLGLGQPSTTLRKTALRRLSSGSSFGSDMSLDGTPTRRRGIKDHDADYYNRQRMQDRHSIIHLSDSSPPVSGETGKFGQELELVDDVDIGEFGRVMKVRYRDGYGSPTKQYALKKSKRMEGVRHRQRLLEEAEILKRFRELGSHPNVLNYVDSWEQDEALFIQTDLCELGNYAHFLAEYGARFERLDDNRCWKVLAELSSGLKFIHDANVIHLDIKPANIFLTSEGRFVIGDFGMASKWPRTTDGGFEREGDRMYLAAEVLQGEYGKAADIFSLGMTMLESAANIVVPDMGSPWHKLRHDDFSEVSMGEERSELLEVIKGMMRRDVKERMTISQVFWIERVAQAREGMEAMRRKLVGLGFDGPMLFSASALARGAMT